MSFTMTYTSSFSVDSLLQVFISDVMFMQPIVKYLSGLFSSSGIGSVLSYVFFSTPVFCSGIFLLSVILPGSSTPVCVVIHSTIVSFGLFVFFVSPLL